jgi:hypothetical protein
MQDVSSIADAVQKVQIFVSLDFSFSPSPSSLLPQPKNKGKKELNLSRQVFDALIKLVFIMLIRS